MSLEPIRKRVFVDCPTEVAFATFTREIATWWPVETHSLSGSGSTEVIFEGRAGGRLYERSPDGGEGDWADVEAWEPPRRLLLRWRVNPKRGPTWVEVTFESEGGGTRLTLVHSGWELLEDRDGREDYERGWDRVLSPYLDRVSGWRG